LSTFYQSNYVNTNDNLDLSENLKVNDFLCPHCNRIKLSTDLIKRLTKLKNEYKYPFYVVYGYQCREYFLEKGENPDNSHSKGMAVDIHFGGKADLLDILDYAVKEFIHVGLVREITGEYYLHLGSASNSLYWLAAKKENASDTEYIYYSDYRKMRYFIESRPEFFKNIKI